MRNKTEIDVWGPGCVDGEYIASATIGPGSAGSRLGALRELAKELEKAAVAVRSEIVKLQIDKSSPTE